MISYGPCQTPTLGFCVDRHDQITNHKPEAFWVLQVACEAAGEKRVNLDWDRGRCFDREVAVMFLNTVKGQQEGTVTSVTTKRKEKERPIALNTVELMRIASSGLGMGPAHAMQLAERLYTSGYISYPRTETTQYAEQFDLKEVVRQQQHTPDWADTCRALLASGLSKPRKGHDAGDHPPITPCRAAGRGELEGESWRIYDYIVRHFLATVSYNCKYDQTVAAVQVGGLTTTNITITITITNTQIIIIIPTLRWVWRHSPLLARSWWRKATPRCSPGRRCPRRSRCRRWPRGRGWR